MKTEKKTKPHTHTILIIMCVCGVNMAFSKEANAQNPSFFRSFHSFCFFFMASRPIIPNKVFCLKHCPPCGHRCYIIVRPVWLISKKKKIPKKCAFVFLRKGGILLSFCRRCCPSWGRPCPFCPCRHRQASSLDWVSSLGCPAGVCCRPHPRLYHLLLTPPETWSYANQPVPLLLLYCMCACEREKEEVLVVVKTRKKD